MMSSEALSHSVNRNAGGKALFSKAYDHYAMGKIRDELQLKDMESTLWTETYNEKGEPKVYLCRLALT